MAAIVSGHTNIAIALLKAKADINAKDKVRVGLAGWMVVCVHGEHPLGLSALEPRWRVVAASAMPMPFPQSRRYRMGRMRWDGGNARITTMMISSVCSSR